MGDVYTNPPQSRNEAILNSIVESTTYTDPPQSRIEDLLLQVKDVIEEGGHDESATRASIAPTESDSAHASKNIEVGEQFYLSDDKLYTATSAISQGDAIVVYPTAGYNCKPSKSVTGQIGDRVTYADNGVLGAKNLNATKYFGRTHHGITFTVNSDGSITLSGTQDGSNTEARPTYENFVLSKGHYKASCKNADSTHYALLVNHDTSGRIATITDENDYEFSLNSDTTVSIIVSVVKDGVVTTPVTMYPMIRLATDTDNIYVPYAETNRKLTLGKTDTSVIGTVENGATASQAYAVGEHFIRGGKFCTVTATIALNDPLSTATNYKEGALGDYINKHYYKSVTVAAGSYADIAIPAITNYIPFACTCGTVGAGSSSEFEYAFSVDSTSKLLNNVKIHNKGSSERTWIVDVFMIYVKADTVVREAI